MIKIIARMSLPHVLKYCLVQMVSLFGMRLVLAGWQIEEGAVLI